ncbi:MAG: DUF2971 domain-containing protein [Methylococcales bacterium]|nr:DUF2971 domain-containing protein [Methylococcales bacterium]
MDIPKRLYKYESVNTYSLANLKNQQVYFSKPINFNDPFDCAIGCTFKDISQNDLEAIYEHYLTKSPSELEFKKKFGKNPNKYFLRFLQKSVEELFFKSRNEVLNNRGVTCFSELSDEILMWSHYADKHKGFCLEFDSQYEPFDKAIDVKYSKKISHVDPVSIILDSDPDQVLKMVTTKYKSWEYEKEWRSIHTEGNVKFGYSSEALTGIYFGSKIDYAHFEIIALIIQGQNPDVKLYEGSISEDKYGVSFKEVRYMSYLKAKDCGMV